MEIDYITKKEQNKTRTKKDARYDMLFIRVSQREALVLINSLSAQLIAKNPNVGRSESFTKDGTYFSIGVEFKEGE